MKYLFLLFLFASCGLKRVDRTIPEKKEILCKKQMKESDYTNLLSKTEKDSRYIEALACAQKIEDNKSSKFFLRKINLNELSKANELKYYKIIANMYLRSGRYDQYARLRKKLSKFKDDEFLVTEAFYFLKFSKLNNVKRMLPKIKEQEPSIYPLFYAWFLLLNNKKKEALKSLLTYNDKKDVNFLILYSAIREKKLNVTKLKDLNIIQKQYVMRSNASK